MDKRRKDEFLEKAIKYFKENKLFLFEEDVKKLYDISGKKEYGSLLLYSYDMYKGNIHLNALIQIAYEVIERAKENRIIDVTKCRVVDESGDGERD